ncbi:hypothetical protein CLH61_08240 [Marinobacter profundi]|uniref:Uncharacterized protein n=1 Tax=Marinobacter profundi TaxID=2666256 RepID=A0A2G1ULZ6_9GAMM|nr:hypothetical protein CLH61_08240 [Marinobacter profundi]
MSESCKCGDEAKVQGTIEFHCEKCESSIEKFEIKKPLKVASIAAILAYGGSQFIDYAITDNRYPMSVEYAVMDACVNSYASTLSYGAYGSKKKICLCALEETMNEISYIRYKVDEKGFLGAFRENVRECI